MANQLQPYLLPAPISVELAQRLAADVRLWMEKNYAGLWQICAAVPGPRNMTVRFDVPDEIVQRIARFMHNGQAGFAMEKAIQGNGRFG